jgi:hypothetical protein
MVKVKSLCFILKLSTSWRLIGEWRGGSTHSLTSALDGGEWLTSRPGRFTPREKSPWYPLDRRLGGHKNRSGRGGEEKNSRRKSKAKTPIVQPIAQRYTDWAITALFRADEKRGLLLNGEEEVDVVCLVFCLSGECRIRICLVRCSPGQNPKRIDRIHQYTN